MSEEIKGIPDGTVPPADEMETVFVQSPEVIAAAEKALVELHNRPFSGRHPELGPMFKCQVCQLRHRKGERDCKQVFKELWIDEDIETGEREVVYATVPLPGQKRTVKSVLGAKMFSSKRRQVRPNAVQLRVVDYTRAFFPAFEGVVDPKKQIAAAKKLAIFVVRYERKQVAKKLRRQQAHSRKINRGLAVPGSRPNKFGRNSRGPKLPVAKV